MSTPGHTLQLRRYQLTAETLDEFVRWWQDDLVPVRRSYGFGIQFACVVSQTAELIWVVSYPGDEEAFAAAERRYNELPDRVASISRQPAKPVATHTQFIQIVTPADAGGTG
jgi:hypothetical protein